MQPPPDLTDRTALTHHRARLNSLRDPALFLQEEAACEIQERLNEVNRRFKSPAIVTPFSNIWSKILPGAKFADDSDLLDLHPGAHDLVIHSMSLHWANDPVGQLVQCRRALKPDGLFLGVMFGGHTLTELRTSLAEAEIEIMGGLSPRVAPMGEIRDLGALLQRAGFALPVADSATKTVSYKSAFHLMRDVRAMGESNALAHRQKTTPPRALFDRAAELYSAHYGTTENRISATFEMIFLTGWCPASSQQKPLRPGSAKARLADALNASETKFNS